MAERVVQIPTIVCEHCARTIKLELGELPGVTSVEVDAASRTACIAWEPPAEWDAIQATLEEIGYAPE